MTAEEFLAEWNSDTDFITARTSGSTGLPKEIHLPKSLVRESALRTIDFFQITSESRLHLCLSPDYIAGKMMIVRAVLSGAKLTDESPSNYLTLLPEGKIDLLAVVPSQLNSLLDNNKLLSHIGNIIVGGSAIPGGLRRKLADSGINAYETYGMTETASHVALRKIEHDTSLPYFALPGVRFSLDDRDCLVIHLDNSSPIITNDIATLEDEYHFHLKGRFDDVIITGGLKVHPAETETAISRLIPDGINYCITSRRHAKWGEEVVLAIEQQTETETEICLSPEQESAIINCRFLPAYQRPKAIIRIPEFPRTSSGKIARKRLKELLATDTPTT